MFNFKSVLDQAATASKQSFAFVQDKVVRGSLETLVDAQVEFTKTFYDTTLDLSKQFVEGSKQFDLTKSFAQVAEKFNFTK